MQNAGFLASLKMTGLNAVQLRSRIGGTRTADSPPSAKDDNQKAKAGSLNAKALWLGDVMGREAISPLRAH
jgi:hypothetical protein